MDAGPGDVLTSHALAAVSAGVALSTARRWGSWGWLAGLGALSVYRAQTTGPKARRVGASALAEGALPVLAAAAFRSAAPPPRAALRAVGCLAAAAVTGAVGGSSPGPRGAGSPALSSTALSGTAWRTMLLGVVVGCAAVAGVGRAGPSGLRTVTTVALLLPGAVAAGAGATSHDPVESGVVARTAATWWPLAGVLGLTALLRGRRGRATERPQVDDVDRAAMADFDRRYATPELAPVAVVIAAYDEERGLPAVLASLPGSVCDLPADVVVVDDGSSDGTAGVVDGDPGAYLVRCGTNRGQGAALRLGYRVARQHGARYVLTTDADGQYDPGDLPAVLAPLLEDRADFVTGSRRLGRQHTHDRVRRAGVHVFAGLVSLLVGKRLTDTSFGLRGMRAEVTATVTLNQVQYQSSELLIGVLSHGFRVLEVPGTMHLRSSGGTKKGRNLVYGRRYAGVVLGTWWREGCPRPVTETAPALSPRSAAPRRWRRRGPTARTAR